MGGPILYTSEIVNSNISIEHFSNGNEQQLSVEVQAGRDPIMPALDLFKGTSFTALRGA